MGCGTPPSGSIDTAKPVGVSVSTGGWKAVTIWPPASGCRRPALTGVVADPEGNVYGGPFVPGLNPICMTFEVTLEEWLPAR